MSSADRVLALVLAGTLLPCCAACSPQWKFTRAEDPISGPARSEASLLAAPGMPVAPSARPRETPPASQFTAHDSAVIPAGGAWSAPVFEPPREPVFDPVPLVSDHAAYTPGEFESRPPSKLGNLWQKVRTDHGNYYSWPGMRELLYGVAAGSLLANTSLDDDFQNWYQNDVRSSGTGNFAGFWNTFGEGQIFIPAFASLALVGGMFEDRPLLGPTGDFSCRVTRTYLVGAPPMLFMQACLGGSRPGESSVGSQWKPFDDNNAVSGHAFVGAVPFITAAKMTEDPWAKGCLYFCSVLTPWSRIDRDAHYLSQACLGWWMAYLACCAVDDTEHQDRRLTFTPLITPELAGIGMTYRR